jgi:type 1 fimbria pilin
MHKNQLMVYKNCMKRILTILFLLLVFISNAQRTMFGGNNNYVGPVAPPSLVTTGLVLNLDAGNASSYNGTGTTWTDLSDKGNNGTLINTITHTASNPGYLIFNGNGNAIAQGGRNPYVSLPQSTDFDFGTGDFTFEMWAYTTAGNPHPDFITLNQNLASYAALRIEYWNNSLNILHSYDGNSHVNGPNIPFTLNSWQQIVISRISGTAKVYLNGDLKSTYSLPGSLLAQQETRIGDLRGSLGYYSFSGNISIVKIFKNKGLTDTEVTNHFNLTKYRFGL